MSTNLQFKAKLNAFSSYINFCILSVLVFFINPYLVNFLGATNFGILKSIQKLMDFASIADGRSSQALKWVIANKKDLSDSEKQQAIGSSIRVLIFFSPILLLIIGVIVFILPYSIKSLDKDSFEIVRIAGLIGGLNIILNPLFSIPDSILVGINEAHKSTFIKTFWMVISNISMVLVAFFGGGIVGIVSVTLCISVLIGLHTVLLCKKKIHWFGVKKPKKEQVSGFFSLSFWTLLWSFNTRLMLSSEILLLSFFIGAELVTNYTFTTYIYTFALSIALMTTSAAMPGLGNMYGNKNEKVVQKIISIVREINLSIATLFACLILFFNESFVTLWVGNDYYLGTGVNLLIAILMFQLILIRNESQIQDVSLNIRKKVLTGTLGAILGPILSIVLYMLFNNIYAIFYGLILGRIIISLGFPRMVNKQYSIISNYKNIFFSILIISTFFILSKFVPIANSWIVLAFYSIISILVIFVLAYIFILSSDSKKLLLGSISKRI